jgi:hypothetical protein
MFDTEALKNTMSTNTLAVKNAILPPKPKRHSVGSILRRTQIPGVPTNMKSVGKDGAMTARLKKNYGFESIDIDRILETSSQVLTLGGLHRRALARARAIINARTSLAGKLSNTRKSISSNNNPKIIYRPQYSPNEPRVEREISPKWNSKG